MSADEAILESVGAGEQPPTLRLYAWQPACLSLGIGQKASDADGEALARHGWDMVRRPTGGRAILHVDELTYSLSLPADHPLAAADIVTSYRQISTALMEALQTLGAAPHSERRTQPADKHAGPVCFEVPSHYEITIEGRKLVGSAQMRRKSGLLQHGTLPLYGDITRICDALYYEDEATREAARHTVHSRAATLEEALGRRVSWDEAATAVIDGFRKAFDITFTESAISPSEVEAAHLLNAEKYGADTHVHAR